jgi:hypothetical protein
VPNCIEKHVSIPTADGRKIILTLCTDSEHLAKFFSMNWPAHVSSEKSDAVIYALKGNAESYQLSPTFNGPRWFCPKTKQVWVFGNEYYGNLKVTVRGLCSELASDEQMFLHGCAMAIDGHGLVLSGISGAGKTTTTAALLKALGTRLKIVNDDWGPFSLTDGKLCFTKEPYLHMKYPSVKTLIPALEISPALYVSESFYGDTSHPHARLLIDPQKVFGQNGLQDTAILKMFVVVTRDLEKPAEMRPLSLEDMPLLEQGIYSRIYDRTERFFNGSLLLTNEISLKRESDRYRTLVQNFPCFIVNNSGTPEETAEHILLTLKRVTLSNG